MRNPALQRDFVVLSDGSDSRTVIFDLGHPLSFFQSRRLITEDTIVSSDGTRLRAVDDSGHTNVFRISGLRVLYLGAIVVDIDNPSYTGIIQRSDGTRVKTNIA